MLGASLVGQVKEPRADVVLCPDNVQHRDIDQHSQYRGTTRLRKTPVRVRALRRTKLDSRGGPVSGHSKRSLTLVASAPSRPPYRISASSKPTILRKATCETGSNHRSVDGVLQRGCLHVLDKAKALLSTGPSRLHPPQRYNGPTARSSRP